MSERKSVTLAVKDVPGLRLVVVMSLSEAGDLRVNSTDSGDRVTDFFGPGEYDFWVDLKPEAAERLMALLLEDRLAGAPEREAALAALCAERGLAAPAPGESPSRELLWAVAEETLRGDLDAVKRVRERCEAEGVPFTFETWFSPDRG